MLAATLPVSDSASSLSLRRPHRPKFRAAEGPVESYLHAINETPLLSATEEKELGYRIQQGDPEARDHMVRANLRLVVNIARSYGGKGLDLQDLIEEGNLGLLRAVERFDPNMNTRFSTYAVFWIKQSMRRALINSGKTIRIPTYMVDLLTRWRRAVAILSERLGRTPSEEEVGRYLRLPRKRLAILKQAVRLYQGGPQKEADDGPSFAMDLLDEHTPAPEAALVRSETIQQVLGLLDTLDPREAAVLRMRFGLDNEEPRTLKEIGERLGLTRERVRQLESLALRRLGERITRIDQPEHDEEEGA